jgi:hypothetical protein
MTGVPSAHSAVAYNSYSLFSTHKNFLPKSNKISNVTLQKKTLPYILYCAIFSFQCQVKICKTATFVYIFNSFSSNFIKKIKKMQKSY